MPHDEPNAHWRPRPKYQVFISSTFIDLHDEREAVTWEILKARHIPAGMENFPATDDRGWRIIQRTIDLSDYYVVIVAGRYGTVDPSTGISWTHREYRYARESKIPVLAFIRADAHITADKSERVHALQDLLTSFKTELESAHLCQRWGSVGELKTQVVQAIQNQIGDDEDSDCQRPGWYRGSEIPSGVALEEFARLSSENADLKRELAIRTTSQLEVLSLVSAETGQLASGGTKHATRVRVARWDRGGANVAFSRPTAESIQSFVEDEEFTIWLTLRVANDGNRAAKQLVADFRATPIESLVIHKRAAPEPEISFAARNVRTPFYLDPSEHVYVDQRRVSDDVAFVRQRIKQVSAGGYEDLIRMGFRAMVNSSPGDQDVDVTFDYDVRSEDGVCDSGSFTVTIQVRGSRELPADVALKEYSED